MLGELENNKRYSDEFLFHATLNFQNRPFYLKEFVGRCEQQSLRYVGDAEPTLSWSGTIPTEIALQFDQLCESQVAIEQHMDFVNNTTSRRSLLCLQSIPANRGEQSQRFSRLFDSGSLENVSNQAAADVAVFRNAIGRKITTRNPARRDALESIGNVWPKSVAFETLAHDHEGDRSVWETDLFNCHAAGMIEFSLRPSPCARMLDERPTTTRLVRWQATSQDFVTKLRHQVTRLSQLQRDLLQRLDGTNSQTELAALVASDEKLVAEQLDQLRMRSLLLKRRGY